MKLIITIMIVYILFAAIWGESVDMCLSQGVPIECSLLTKAVNK